MKAVESSTQFSGMLCSKFEWGKRMENMWRSEYLVGVLGKAKRIWKKVRPITKVEVVLVEDEFQKRQTWRLAVVQEVFCGSDGKAWSARVRPTSGLLNRPIRRLFPLEVASEGEVGELISGEVDKLVETFQGTLCAVEATDVASTDSR